MATGQEPFPTDLCREIGIMAGKYANGVSERGDKDWYRKKVYIYAPRSRSIPGSTGKPRASRSFMSRTIRSTNGSLHQPIPATSRKTSLPPKRSACHPTQSGTTTFSRAKAKGQTRTGSTSPTPISAAAPSTKDSFRKKPCAARRRISPISPPGRTKKDAKGDWQSHLMTRTPVGKADLVGAVGCGDPTPIVIKGLHRVLNLKAQANFSHAGLQDKSFEEIRTIVNNGVSSGPEWETFDLIAAAAPDLKIAPEHGPKTRPRSSTSSIPLSRCSHWPRSSRRQAKASSSTRAPLDAAIFHNDDTVVYVLQALAAGHVSRKDDEFTLKFCAADKGNVSTRPSWSRIKNKHPKSLLDLVQECVSAFSHV